MWLEEQCPILKDKLILLGTYFPLTFNRWCGAHKGSYVAYNHLKGFKSLYVKNTIKGIPNFFIGSQWVQNSGGLPTAAAGGRFAILEMCKRMK